MDDYVVKIFRSWRLIRNNVMYKSKKSSISATEVSQERQLHSEALWRVLEIN